MGCRGPTTYNSCSTVKWNNGVSFPIGSGHGCIGCSEAGFWDNGPFYQRLSPVLVPGIDATPDQLGKTLTILTAAGVGAHLVSHWAWRAGKSFAGEKGKPPEEAKPEEGGK
jgi:hydrogenase small subunit